MPRLTIHATTANSSGQTASYSASRTVVTVSGAPFGIRPLEEHLVVTAALDHHRALAQRAQDAVTDGEEVLKRGPLGQARQQFAVRAGDAHGAPIDDQAVFCHTETCEPLSDVNGSRFHPAQRSVSRMPAIRAIRSSSAGHT